MKKLSFINGKKFIISLLVIALTLSAASFGLFNFIKPASAAATTIHIPKSNLEYKALSSPIDAVHDKNYTAIVHDASLLVYLNGEYKAPVTNFTSIKQVKKLDNSTVIVSDNGSLYEIPVHNLSIKSAMTDTNNNVIGGNYFDLSSKYLVTAYGTDGAIYSRSGSRYTYLSKLSLDGDKPIATNENGKIFFVNDGIYMVDATAPQDSAVKISDHVPNKMIADNQNVYYLINGSNNVYKLEIANGHMHELIASSPDYDLGNLITPSGISFNSGNLIVTDSTQNSVQEFAVLNNELSFTGFAIATNKTAYNRISSNATDVEKQGDTVAVLDNYKITVIKNSKQNNYLQSNYANFIMGKDVEKNIQYFTLGASKILYSTTATKIKMLSIESATETAVNLPVSSVLVDDMFYQSGTFYVLVHTSTSSIVYAIDEKDSSLTLKELINQSNSSHFSAIAVDVMDNIYLADQNGVKKYSLDDEGKYALDFGLAVTGVQKMQTDLGGKVFMLTNGAIRVFDGSSTIKTATPAAYINGDVLSSFALNYEKSEVALLYKGKEYLCTNADITNDALDKATVSDSVYITTGDNADINRLTLVKIRDGANVYSVNKIAQKLEYKGLTKIESEYVYVCDVRFSNTLTMCAVYGNNGLALVNKADMQNYSAEELSAPKEVVVSTDVNAYFMPLVTKDGEFSLSGENVRLAKNTILYPTARISVLGKEFYYATVTIDGKACTCFIPIDFTALSLAEEEQPENYVIEKVSEVKLYEDAALTTAIKTIANGSKVKILSKDNGVAFIKVEIDGQVYCGYISESAINNEPQIMVRNMLLIIGATAVVAGTLTYFITKKKKR